MFGGILSKLLGGAARKKGGDLLSRVATNYGDDITRSLATNQGDDAARSILSTLTTPVPEVAAPTVRRTMLSQLKNGVDSPSPINPNIADNFAVEGATNKALKNNKGVGAKVNNFGKSVEDAGTKLKNNQIVGTIRDKKLLERSPEAIKWAEQYGFSPNQYEDVANILTGKEGVLANFNNNALKNAKRSVIMPDDARVNALKSVDKAITLEPHVKKNLKRAINDAYDVTTGNIGTRLQERGETRMAAMGEADIYDMHKTVQDLEKMAYEVSGKGADDAQRILRNYAGDLKAKINETAKEIYQNPDNVQELTAALEGANLSPQLNKDIIDSIRKGTDYLGIRSMQSPAVTLGKIAEHEKMAPLAGGMNGNGQFGNPIMQVANEVVGKPLAAITGKGLQTGGRAVQMASKGGGGKVPAALKYGAAGLAGYGILNNLTGGGNNGQPVDMSMMASMPGSGTTLPGAAEDTMTVGGYDRQQLENAYVAALMDNNADAADAIGNMIGMLDNKQADAEKANGSSTAGAKAANAAQAMQRLMQVYQQGGGAQGPVGALGQLLNKATFGTMNPNQAAYEDMLQAAAVQVARANGETGVLSNQDIQNYMKMLPTFSDNPQQAQIKLQTIMSGLQTMQ